MTNLDIQNALVGNTQVEKIYLGNTLIYPTTPPGPEPQPVYSGMPLTFEIMSGGTIKWVVEKYMGNATTTIQYKINEGSWTNVTAAKAASATEIHVQGGDIIQFRGNNSVYSTGDRDYCHFRSTTSYVVKGNIMSLISGTGFETLTQISGTYAFASIFEDNQALLSADNLVLPATTLTENCYYKMFSGCTNLVNAPELPATTLANACYQEMFGGCSNINYIKCLATDISATNCTNSWVNGVSATGTFVKHPNMNNWTTGPSGIPFGWTVQDATL